MKNTPWFGSAARKDFVKNSENIPAWKRFFLCFINYSTWSKARAYSTVASDLIMSGDPHGDEFVLRSDKLWAKVFDLSEPK